MGEVLSGFAIVWMIILVGFAVGKTGVLGPHAQPVLSRTAFFVASPCLLFTTISTSDISLILGPQLWVAAISAGLMLLVFFICSKTFLPQRKTSETLIGGLSASLVNSANLGLPIAAYVLGDAAWAAPVILFQLALYTPLTVLALDLITERENTDRQIRRVRRRGFFGMVWHVLRTIVRNPVIVGSMLGIVVSVFDIQLFEPLSETISLIAGASIPCMLLAFGISLVGSRPLQKSLGRRSAVWTATAIKLLLHPLAAWLLAQFVFQLSPSEVLVATVMASLPAAQNTFVTASRFNTGLVVAKDAVLVTTILAIPAMILVAVLLA